jgi:UDP-N-acetylmuramyl tripeptide synthase
VELDRRAAIHSVIECAEPGDVVLITGRGHEERRRLGSRIETFDDREVAASALAEVGYVEIPTAVASRGLGL